MGLKTLKQYRELEKDGKLSEADRRRVKNWDYDGVAAEMEIEKKYSEDLKQIEQALNES